METSINLETNTFQLELPSGTKISGAFDVLVTKTDSAVHIGFIVNADKLVQYKSESDKQPYVANNFNAIKIIENELSKIALSTLEKQFPINKKSDD